MKPHQTPVELNLSNPQLALENILTAEIEVAEQVSAANDKAGKAILSAQSDIIKLKEQILADARARRDEAFKDGVKNAHEAAEKMVAAAQVESEKSMTAGRQFLDEAVDSVMGILIGQSEKR